MFGMGRRENTGRLKKKKGLSQLKIAVSKPIGFDIIIL